MGQKTKPNHMLPPGNTSQLKVKSWKMTFQANGIQRKAGVAVLISEEIDFKKVKKDTEGHFIMIKGIRHQEDIIIIISMLPIRESRNM